LHHAELAIQALERQVANLRALVEAPMFAAVSEADKTKLKELTALLSIAHYNKGCESEHLGKYIQATQSFVRAVNLQSSRTGN
jgi:hypothetical protein